MSKRKTNPWWKERGFKRQADLIIEIQGLVKRCKFNVPLNSEDETFMLWVFSHHNGFDGKVGCGLSQIILRKHPDYKRSHCFYFVRKDSSEIDISWRAALEPDGGSTPEKKHLRAMRHDVKYQLDNFRESNSYDTCYLCGESLHGVIHIDHVVHFDKLANDFINEHGFSPVGDLGLYNTLSNVEYRNKWQRYHSQNAVLRPVHELCNLKRDKHKIK